MDDVKRPENVIGVKITSGFRPPSHDLDGYTGNDFTDQELVSMGLLVENKQNTLLSNNLYSEKDDIFSLGCVFDFVFNRRTAGKRGSYLSYIKYHIARYLLLKKSTRLVDDLISNMINPNEKKRFRMREVIAHPVTRGIKLATGKVDTPIIPKPVYSSAIDYCLHKIYNLAICFDTNVRAIFYAFGVYHLTYHTQLEREKTVQEGQMRKRKVIDTDTSAEIEKSDTSTQGRDEYIIACVVLAESINGNSCDVRRMKDIYAREFGHEMSVDNVINNIVNIAKYTKYNYRHLPDYDDFRTAQEVVDLLDQILGNGDQGQSCTRMIMGKREKCDWISNYNLLRIVK